MNAVIAFHDINRAVCAVVTNDKYVIQFTRILHFQQIFDQRADHLLLIVCRYKQRESLFGRMRYSLFFAIPSEKR
ncbi:hypothetical protein D3C78_1441430 [compost metagenome]